MARYLFTPVPRRSGAATVRFDTASGSTSPAEVSTRQRPDVVYSTGIIPASDTSDDLDPVILGPDDVLTLFQKEMNKGGQVVEAVVALVGVAANDEAPGGGGGGGGGGVAGVASFQGRTGTVLLQKADVVGTGLAAGDVGAPTSAAVTAALSGKADLDGDGKVPAGQLPAPSGTSGSIAGVLHGAVAGTARPDAPLVIWVGTVDPVNAAASDLVFINDGAPPDPTPVPTPDTTPPAVPTGLSATPTTNGATLDWADNAESDLARYDYRVGTSNPPTGNLVSTGLTSMAAVTGLTGGTLHYAQVRAVDSTGNPSAYSAVVSFTPTAPAQTPTAPGAPTIGTATAGDGTMTVPFTPPASDGGSPITGYTVTTSGGQTATGASSPITVTVPNGTAQTATVRAINAVGTGPASAASNSVTPAAAPAGPTLPAFATFTRADGAGLPNTETGNFPWTTTTVGGTGTAVYGVRSNAAAIWGTGTGGAAVATIETLDPDVTVRAKLVAFPGSGSWGMAFRLADRDNYFYILVSTTAVSLNKRINGTFALVQNVTGQTNVAGETWEVVLSGTSVIVRKQGGANVISSTQAELQTATRHGFLLPIGDTTARLDDFEVLA